MITHLASEVVSCSSLLWAHPAFHNQLPKPKTGQVTGGRVHVKRTGNFRVMKSTLENPFPATCRIGTTACYSSKRWAPDKLDRSRATVHAVSTEEVEREDSDFERNSTKQSANLNFLQRRELLWATTGTISYLTTAGRGQSAPVPASDLQNCSLVNLETPGETENCCPTGESILEAVAFEFEDLPMRTRRPAHILSADLDYVTKYNEAYKLMKALPDDDPRSFNAQWHVHCAMSNKAYIEPGNTSDLPLEYHCNWAFLPWHRMFLYFHERILGDLIGDPTFALPFWNWDNQRSADGGNQMPRMVYDDLGDVNDELRDQNRDPAHCPPTLIDLASLGTGIEDDIIRSNLSVLHRAIVSTAATDLFMGGSYVANQTATTKCPGSCEFYVHDPVHMWTGDPSMPDNRDMGSFAYAARDPLFFQHLGNIDRLWVVWKSLPMDESTRSGLRSRCRGKTSNADFLDTEFAFYDQNQQLVHVKVRDTLDTTKLCYHYEMMVSDADWIYFETTPSGSPKPSQSDIEPFSETANVLNKDGPTSFLLTRREATDNEIAAHADEGLVAEDLEETLLVKGVNVPVNKYMIYWVFINLPTADKNTSLDIHEFAGIISNRPRPTQENSPSEGGMDFRLSIGATVKKLDIPIGESVSVTFVPQGQEEDVPFDGVQTEWR